MNKLVKLSGISLILGGFFLIVTNAGLTPLLNVDDALGVTAGSSIFLYRMIAAAITVAFLAFGSIGIFLIHPRSTNFLTISFMVTFFGNLFLFANEWFQIFVFPELARINPETLNLLDSSDSFNSYDLGAMIAISTFSLGWILYAIAMLRLKQIKSIGPALIISGFVLTPLITGIISPMVGVVIGNTVMGIGFGVIGSGVLRINSQKPLTTNT